MIALPFIIFGVWALNLYRRRGFSVGLFAVLLYFVTAFGSILIDMNGYYTYSCPKLDVGFFAPLVYCALMCFCVYPLTKLKPLKFIKARQLKGLTLLLCVYLFVFLVVLLVSFTRINEILFQESLAEVRNELYTGEAVSFYNHLNGLPRYICAICATLSPSSYIMCFFFVYSITYLNNKWWYNVLLLVSSLTPILISINVADRSQIVYWILTFILSVAFFYKNLSAKSLSIIGIMGLIFSAILVVYFFMVTISRFENRDGGTGGGLVAYLGQNYINFCSFLNHVEPGKDLSQLMPVTDKYILKTIHTPARTAINGFELNGFRTFLGGIYGALGPFVMILFSIFYYIILSNIVNRINKQKITRLDTFSFLWVLSLVVILGVFGHFYSTENSIFAMIIWIYIGKYIQKNNFSRITKGKTQIEIV